MRGCCCLPSLFIHRFISSFLQLTERLSRLFLTLIELPSHPSHPNDLNRSKQTHTPAETHEVGEISVRYVVTCICAFIRPPTTYLRSLRGHFGWWHPVDAVWGGLFWKASNSCRINALKVAFYNIVAALFVMQVIVA